MSIYIVGTRYSKNKVKTLRAMGFKENEISHRRCRLCSAKLMIHCNSLVEWKGFDYLLICGECVGKIDGDPLIKMITPRAHALLERGMAHLRWN